MTLEHLDTFIAFAVVMVGVSLLITVLTQMISALLGLRGTNLKWGIKTLLEPLLKTINPVLVKHAEDISQAVLHHSLVSDSTVSKFKPGSAKWWNLPAKWKLASTIRVDELVNILGKLDQPPPPPALPVQQWAWQQALGVVLNNNSAQRAGSFTKAVGEILKLSQQFAPGVINNFDKLLPQIVSAPQKAVGDIELWFDSTMDRVSQRFTVQMRIWTVIFSVLVAFALHLDAFRLVTQLSSDAQLRASLVTSAEAITKQANEVLGTSRSPIPAAYVEAIKQLKEQDPVAKQTLGDPPAFESLEDGKTWLRMQLKGSDQTDALVKKYEDLVQAALKTEIEKLKDQAGSIKDELSKTEFQLVPDYKKHDWDFWPGWPPKNPHFWGILAAAGLLSLGAPFWFNILKTLTNLRPILATKQEKEQKQPPASA